jgi:hypothetical protein
VLIAIPKFGNKCGLKVGRFVLAALLGRDRAVRGARFICVASNDSEGFCCNGWPVTSNLSFRVQWRSTCRARFS